jgi:hypothetical protein
MVFDEQSENFAPVHWLKSRVQLNSVLIECNKVENLDLLLLEIGILLENVILGPAIDVPKRILC